MIIARFSFFLSLCFFSFSAFSTEDNIKHFLTEETTAGWNPNCSHCKNQSRLLPFSTEKLECLQTISQKECKEIPAEEKRACDSSDEMKLSDTGSFLLKCVKDTVASYQFIFDLLWYGIKNSSSWLFESEQDTKSSPSKNYISIEFYKAYQTSKGAKLERFLNAAKIVGKQTFMTIYSTVKNFLQTEYESFKCYNSISQFSLACVFAVSLLIPIPGSSLINVIKTGSKIGSKTIKLPSPEVKNSLAKSIQLKTATNHIRLNFDNFRANVLKKSKSLTKKQKAEILNFFKNNNNKEKFITAFSKKLNSDKSNITKNRIRSAVMSSLIVGSVNVLSPKSAMAITEGLVDTLATKYVNKTID